MKIQPFTLVIVIILIMMIVIFTFVVIKNTNHVISQNILKKRKPDKDTLKSQDVDDTEKIALIVSAILNLLEDKNEISKKRLVAIKDKKGYNTKYEICSKENVQWKNKNEWEQRTKYLEYSN